MTTVATIVAVMAAGAIGGLGRFWLAVAFQQLAGKRGTASLPWGTLLANLAGCFLLGALVGLASTGWTAPPPVAEGLTAGFCGGLTTFSTFSVETATLVQEGRAGAAAGYVTVSVVIGIAALMTGQVLGATLL